MGNGSIFSLPLTQTVSDDVLVETPGVELEPGHDVCLVNQEEVGELHGGRTGDRCEEVTLPLHDIRLVCKAALGLLAALAGQALTVPTLDGVGAVLLFADGNLVTSLRGFAGIEKFFLKYLRPVLSCTTLQPLALRSALS